MKWKLGCGGWVALYIAIVCGAKAGEPPAREITQLLVPLPASGPGIDPLAMVLMRAGTFQMGCLADERGLVGRESPQHSVTLTLSFYLGRYEITQGEWEAVMGTNPAHPPRRRRQVPGA